LNQSFSINRERIGCEINSFLKSVKKSSKKYSFPLIKKMKKGLNENWWKEKKWWKKFKKVTRIEKK